MLKYGYSRKECIEFLMDQMPFGLAGMDYCK